ncbi:hypothetical protein [Streptomyces shenzhenensis]|uniref:hypothetical protein n=1 Tax=Streptomyces shenzhenensis TaxID=943815 RepID=UPI001604B07D|nr:hypothetical protein [Streptomyces shenzhenensis]
MTLRIGCTADDSTISKDTLVAVSDEGTARAFPEVATGAAQQPDATVPLRVL